MDAQRRLRGRSSEREVLDRLLENVRGGQSARPGHPRRGGCRQDGAAAPLRSAGVGLPGRADRGRRVRDGAAVRGAASALRADARPARRAPRAAAGRPARRARPLVRRRPRPLPGRPGRAQPAGRGRRGAAAAVPRRRRAVARRRLGPGPRASSRDGCWRSRWRSCSPCATRPSERELVGLPELRLEGLADEDARALLATVIPGRLDERVRDRIVAETRGNPLALLELPRGLSAAQLAGGFGLPEPLPLSGRIEESFLRRLEELPRETRLLLLVAAAEPVGDPALMWRRRDAARGRRHGARARGAGRAAGCRRAGALPPSAGALRRLSVGVRRRAPERARGAGGRDRCRRSSRIAAPGTARRRRRARTRMSRPSSSGRRAGRRPAAGSPRRPRSWGGRPT